MVVVTVCHCSWDIPGVERLPSHSHIYRGTELKGTGRYWDKGPFAGQEIMAMVSEEFEINIYVDWSAVAKALGRADT